MFSKELFVVTKVRFGVFNDFVTFTLNGISSAAINAGGYANVADPANLRYMDFRTGANNSVFFLDAPEPSVIGLMAVGFLSLFARKIRRR